MGRQPGFFDLEERYAELSKAGDPLERLLAVVNFEAFRYRLDKALNRSDRSKGGRPPHDAVLMFKVLVLQALYNLSDDQTEFQIGDRLSFKRFLGLGLADKAPDAKTIWLFRETLTQAKAIDKLFAVFDAKLKESGYLAMSGQIIDATLVAAPRQRNDDAEKQALREGRIPEDWQDNPHKLAQKDRDARWTLKRGRAKTPPTAEGAKRVEIAIPVFGYKNHISTDRRHGFIRRWAVSSAADHDGRWFKDVLDGDNTGSEVWADTAYRSRRNEELMARRGLRSKVHFRKPPGKPLPDRRAKANAARSKVRSAVEHVFAHQKGPMALFIRTVGIARATTKIGMANLVYNMRRLVWWEGRTVPA
jgi:IS5 family transposase